MFIRSYDAKSNGNYGIVKYTLDDIKEFIKSLHGNTITLIDETYVSIARRCTCVDSKRGTFKTTPLRLLLGCNRSNFKTQKTFTYEQIDRVLKFVHGDELTLIEQRSYKYMESARFLDKDFGERNKK
jgi:hypothetical protein